MSIAPRIPTKIEKFSNTEMKLGWSTGEAFAVPFVEIRFHCPCASCVDEHTGQRIIERTSINPEVRPVDVQLVGRYAIQISWSDSHSTGMYHYDTLWALCEAQGRKL